MTNKRAATILRAILGYFMITEEWLDKEIEPGDESMKLVEELNSLFPDLKLKVDEMIDLTKEVQKEIREKRGLKI